MTKKNIFLRRFYLLIIFVFLILNCLNKTKETDTNYIELFDSFSPKELNQWAITRFDSLKLRDFPEEEAKIINYLPLASVVEVIKKDNKLSKFTNITDYWYLVDYKGERGWIFGYYLEILNTYEESVKRSEEILFGIK